MVGTVDGFFKMQILIFSENLWPSALVSFLAVGILLPVGRTAHEHLAASHVFFQNA